MGPFKLLLIIYFSLVSLYAGTDGTLRGSVADDSGEPLAGANIFIEVLQIGAAADINGNYIILNIPVGEYDVVCQMMGYEKVTMKQVNIVMDQTQWLNFKLPLDDVELEGVEVLGTRPLVEKGTTSKKVTIDKEAIQSLPIRDLSSHKQSSCSINSNFVLKGIIDLHFIASFVFVNANGHKIELSTLVSICR